jgi:hypothetical protein
MTTPLTAMSWLLGLYPFDRSSSSSVRRCSSLVSREERSSSALIASWCFRSAAYNAVRPGSAPFRQQPLQQHSRLAFFFSITPRSARSASSREARSRLSFSLATSSSTSSLAISALVLSRCFFESEM